jgi:hypothetical protein
VTTSGRRESRDVAEVVLLGAEVNAAIYSSGSDGGVRAEKPGSDRKSTDP